MNHIIFEQLKKVKVAKLPKYTEKDMKMFIPKQKGGYVSSEFEVGKLYILKLDSYIIKPFEGFTLHDNWNKGHVPTHEIIKAKIVKTMGKMIYVESDAYDLKIQSVIRNKPWDGWLPKKSVKILERL